MELRLAEPRWLAPSNRQIREPCVSRGLALRGASGEGFLMNRVCYSAPSYAHPSIAWAAFVLLLSATTWAGTYDSSSCDVWQAACHYTTSNRESSYDINRVVIHKTEGATAAGAAGWFANCSSQGSAHYTLDKSNGYCYQCVRDRDIAWHAGYSSTNSNSIGIEHSGWVANNDTTTACYDKSALVTKSCVTYYGVPCNRSYILGHSEVPGCASGNGGGADCHTDPGPYWNWEYYIGKCNPVPPSPPPVLESI